MNKTLFSLFLVLLILINGTVSYAKNNANKGKEQLEASLQALIKVLVDENLKQNKMPLLLDEMKLPGMAWMKFDLKEKGNKNIMIVVAYFYTQSFWGKLYWYIFLPFHFFIFYDLLREISKRS